MYADPISGKPEWGLILAPGGGIMGVHSKSHAAPIKTSACVRYADWRFSHEPPNQAQIQKIGVQKP